MFPVDAITLNAVLTLLIVGLLVTVAVLAIRALLRR
jgi:hypothetical protein